MDTRPKQEFWDCSGPAQLLTETHHCMPALPAVWAGRRLSEDPSRSEHPADGTQAARAVSTARHSCCANRGLSPLRVVAVTVQHPEMC